jgi:hypothetical protein
MRKKGKKGSVQREQKKSRDRDGNYSFPSVSGERERDCVMGTRRGFEFYVENFFGIFYHATSFNQSLTNWCVNSAFLNGLDNDGGQPYNATFYTRTNFSNFSPVDTIPAFHPLWNGIGCIYKCYNGGIRNVNDKITYSCICNEPDTGMYCNDITDDTTNTFTWWMILSISVGGALLLSGAVFTARKLFTTRTGGFALSNN